MTGFLYQATIYLSAAIFTVPLATRLGLGSVLGYLLAGIAIGPLLHLVGTESADLQHYAEFGVVMMLFIIGLELEPRALWEMRHRLIGLGGMQIALTTGAVYACGRWLGLETPTALAIGLILALSSTAIVLQTLSEKGLMKTPGGKSTFSVLLTQDIAVIPMLAMLPLLALPAVPHLDSSGAITRPNAPGPHVEADAHLADGHAVMSLVDGLPGWQVTVVTLAAVAAVILAGVYLTRPLFHFISMSKLREIHTATALLVVIAIAFLMTLVGLSPALGAFIAGVVLASSEFRHELEANLEPFKGLLLGLFFITVGAGIDFAMLARELGTVMGLAIGLMLIKGVVLFFLALVFRLKGRDKWLFTLGLAQAGEFGFVLLSFSTQQNVLPEYIAERLLLIIAMTMLMTPLFFIAYEYMSNRMHDSHDPDEPEADEIDDQGPVIIVGIGRFGQVVNRLMQMAEVKTTVLDRDLATIELMRKFGFKGFFGDPTRPELLHAAGLLEARVLVIALDDKHAATQLVRYARAQRPDLHIVARAHDRIHVFELYRAGADDIVREMFDSALRAGRYVLENMDFSSFEANQMETAFYKHDRLSLRELAPLWNPDLPLSENAAYLARSQELHKELETALVSTLDAEEEARRGAGNEDAEGADTARDEGPALAPDSAQKKTAKKSSANKSPTAQDTPGAGSTKGSTTDKAVKAADTPEPASAADQPAETPASAKVAMSE